MMSLVFVNFHFFFSFLLYSPLFFFFYLFFSSLAGLSCQQTTRNGVILFLPLFPPFFSSPFYTGEGLNAGRRVLFCAWAAHACFLPLRLIILLFFLIPLQAFCLFFFLYVPLSPAPYGFVGWLAGWFVGWLVGRSVGRLVAWLVGWLIACLHGGNRGERKKGRKKAGAVDKEATVV